MTALTSSSKADVVRTLGTDQVVIRNENLLNVLQTEIIGLVVDNLAGTDSLAMLILRHLGTCYTSSDAIVEPAVDLDM